jgi:hypothetical protein
VEFDAQNIKSNFRGRTILPRMVIFLLVGSCIPFWVPADKFSRTYGADFMSFHPKLNSALQDYAKSHQGNSFQVTYLGSDQVILQGLYKGKQYPGRLSPMITVKPAGPRRTWVEIKISASDPKISSEYRKGAARDLFQIIEKGTDVGPLE